MLEVENGISCPYLDCSGTVPIGEQGIAFCPKCNQPLVSCVNSKCKAPNRALAQYCHYCGKELPKHRHEFILSALPKDANRPKKVIPQNRDEKLWWGPVSYAFYLWFLTGTGTLYRMSVRDNAPMVINGLGEKFSKSPLLITEKKSSEKGTIPIAVVASKVEVITINLVTGERETLHTARESEIFLADVDERFAGLCCDGDNVYLLAQDKRQFKLVRLSLNTNDVWSFDLPGSSENIAGPFVYQGHVVCFSPAHLFALDIDTVRFAVKQEWPEGFVPFFNRKEITDASNSCPRPALGNFSYGVTTDGAYILGRRHETPEIAVLT
ncbi:MAG: zinc ribbon domain-containing protein, partial [candidate division WOR-3 bacterium]